MRAPLFILGMITATTLATGMIPFSVSTATAQANPFAPVITVNGLGITSFEIEQRATMISLLGASADPRKQAEDDLINDRLQMSAAKRAGIVVSREAVKQGMEEFASRANMSADQFLAAIASEGVEPQTFRDFVEAGMIWREVIRARREVILCGGAVNSPQLLQLSGIGPAAQLRRHGVGVRQASSGLASSESPGMRYSHPISVRCCMPGCSPA